MPIRLTKWSGLLKICLLVYKWYALSMHAMYVSHKELISRIVFRLCWGFHSIGRKGGSILSNDIYLEYISYILNSKMYVIGRKLFNEFYEWYFNNLNDFHLNSKADKQLSYSSFGICSPTYYVLFKSESIEANKDSTI